MTKCHIPEIELNFSNVCGGNCFICAKAHGRGNSPLMSESVFEAITEQLQDVSFAVLQTSGNGDCLLHPHILDWLRCLRQMFPRVEIHTFSSMSLFDASVADAIIRGRLVDVLHTRIDSLDHDIFCRSTGLNARDIFHNLDAALDIVRGMPRAPKIEIGYSSIPGYYAKCDRILGRLPFHGPFSAEEAGQLPCEYSAIARRFPGAVFTRINQSLWAERENPLVLPDPDGTCPKLTAIDQTCWVCPDGRIDVCGYDDGQDAFTIGNVLGDHLADIWNSAERLALIEKIRSRVLQKDRWPCNPRCCRMHRDEDV